PSSRRRLSSFAARRSIGARATEPAGGSDRRRGGGGGRGTASRRRNVRTARTAGTARAAVAPPAATSVHSGADATARVAVPIAVVPEPAPKKLARRRARRFLRRKRAAGSRQRRAASIALSVASRNAETTEPGMFPVRSSPESFTADQFRGVRITGRWYRPRSGAL